MTLLKTPPEVRLAVRRSLAAGAIAEFVVTLDCPAPLPVDAVSLTLTGEVVWFTTSQYGRHRHASRFVALGIPLLTQETELSAGVHELETRVDLSPALPGSWKGDRLAVEYKVEIHVDIPWWPDTRVGFIVPVASATHPNTGAAPDAGSRAIVFVSHASGPPASSPYLELSLGQRSALPGGTLRLSAALGNVALNHYRRLHVALTARERLPTALGSVSNTHTVGRWSVDIEGHPGELQPIPFTLNLPANLTPGFSVHDCDLSWVIEVHADVARGADPRLDVPLEIAAPDPAGLAECALETPLTVGSERLRLIWSRVAAATGLELIEGRLRAVIEDVAIELQREQLDGRVLVAGLLEYPDLGVDLHVERGRKGLLGAVEATWLLVSAREAGQSEVALVSRDAAQLALLRDALASLRGGLVLDASDTRLRVAADTTGLELEPLTRFADELIALARALAQLPSRLPPPAAIAAQAPAWLAAARSLRATIRPGDLQLSIVRDGLTVRVRPEYDAVGAWASTTLTLDPSLAVPSRLHLFWPGDGPVPASDLALDALLIAPPWSAGSRVGLTIDAEGVRISMPPTLADPRLERDRIEALFDLGRHLRGERSPYR